MRMTEHDVLHYGWNNQTTKQKVLYNDTGNKTTIPDVPRNHSCNSSRPQKGLTFQHSKPI